MKIYTFLFVIICLSFVACKTPSPTFNETIEVIDTYIELEDVLKKHSDKVVVLNFWATSCPPCIREMPHFIELQDKYQDDLKVLLVSLDMPRDLEKRVVPFVKKHEITPEVVILGDDNYSAWTEKIDKSWYGALPATLIKDKDKSHFQFGAYESFEDLENQVKPFFSR